MSISEAQRQLYISAAKVDECMAFIQLAMELLTEGITTFQGAAVAVEDARKALIEATEQAQFQTLGLENKILIAAGNMTNVVLIERGLADSGQNAIDALSGYGESVGVVVAVMNS